MTYTIEFLILKTLELIMQTYTNIIIYILKGFTITKILSSQCGVFLDR